MNLLSFFSSENFMPHGHCFLWRSDLLTLHVASDTIIALAYYSIPFGLIYFVARRPDVIFRWVAVLFGTFILACGTTHILGIVVIWNPIYWVDGSIKLVTAVSSILTAFVVWRIMPQALAMPSTAQLQTAVTGLESEVASRRRAEEQVRGLNTILEDRVRERTVELEKANAELQAAIEAKEVLLQEVHHRVKNNLQVVSALLSMQSEGVPGLGRHFQDSASRIEAMSRIHDQLHRSTKVAALDLGDYLKTLAADLGRIYGRSDIEVTFDLPAAPVWIDFEAANPLVLMLNEGLINAFKHAFPPGRGGRIAIKLEALGEAAQVTIADDGIGLAAGSAASGAKDGSMGMNLVNMLAGQIKAKVHLGEDKGTTFVVTLPPAIVVKG